jgi:serine/threonine protein kinase/tetratricopeptide (TPR) repeat protein
MSSDQRARARRIFLEVVDCPLNRRDAEVERLCAGDGQLRAEVEGLLRAAEQAAGFFGAPTQITQEGPEISGTIESARSRERNGDSIGRYKLLEVIGEGGFGVVWMAEQREPVKRRVALKVIKLGMDTRQVIARFEAERQALALMDHPNIARVFDAGSTEAGRPYFVMEYIKGVPILEYCDGQRLDTRARLGLFIDVCHAIQHAHQKGIIHRDVKPGNVLVTMHDGVPVPKVIDFGIAKATTMELTSRTLFTEHRQMIGTPAYMSPEQAEMSGLDIDTRSDVYSLGVLLYELLTGTTPFDQKSLLEAGFAEMMRIIREVEPAKPSTRLSSLGEVGTRTAALRLASDARRLQVLLKGDLDWIVMKCLEKDRNRRYGSASGLADDIRLHLDDQPVAAGPPGALYRLRKFSRRHKGVLAAGTLITTALVLGLAGTTWGMMRATKEAKRANDAVAAETLAKVAAQSSERAAIASAKRAESIGLFMTTALKAADAYNVGGGQKVTVLEAMENALADVEKGRFADDPEAEAAVLQTIGTVMQNNGALQRARAVLRRSLDQRRKVFTGDRVEIAESLSSVAAAEVGLSNLEAAEAAATEALEMNRRLFPGDHAAVSMALHSLGNIRINQFRNAEAEPLVAESLGMLERLAKGDSESLARVVGTLATVKYNLGKNDEAEPLYRRCLDINKRFYTGDHPRVLIAMFNLGNFLQDTGRVAKAEPLFEEGMAMATRLYEGDHQYLATAYNNLGNARLGMGRHADAEPLYLKALDINQRLYPGDNVVVSNGYFNLGSTYFSLARYQDSEEMYAKALAIAERLAEGDRPTTANAMFFLASSRLKLGKRDDARRGFDEAIAMGRRLWPQGSRSLIRYVRASAALHIEMAAPARALTELKEALSMAEAVLPPDAPEIKGIRRELEKAEKATRPAADPAEGVQGPR